MRVEMKGPTNGVGGEEMFKCHFCESDEVNGMAEVEESLPHHSMPDWQSMPLKFENNLIGQIYNGT